MLKLYNTLSKKRESLLPMEEGLYRIYTCGPTVYRDAHIGNLRSYLMADWVKRILLELGNKVIHVKNITDVGHMRQEVLERGEDKVIAAALAEGKTPADIAQFYTDRFLCDESALNILKPDKLPKATDHVKEMVEIIQELIANKLAYEVEGNVYFAVNQFESYGNLSGNINESQLKEAVRVEADPRKIDPRDFTLWKKAEPGRTLKWESPWGHGFPGWHIECSAMSLKYLGDRIDIHTGGVDNIFPHHEGEIAQSEGYTGHSVVNYWLHGQHLLADGVKMAKSSGNAYTVPNISERNIDPMAFRYLCMTARYRNRLNFTFASLKAAEKALNKIKTTFFWAKNDSSDIPVNHEVVSIWKSKYIEAVSDDLDLPAGLDVLWKMMASDLNSSTRVEIVNSFDRIMGLGISESEDVLQVPSRIENMIVSRSEFRKNTQYQESDRLRDDISSDGFVVEDVQDATKIRKKYVAELRKDKWQAISSSADVKWGSDSHDFHDFNIGIVSNGYADDTERCVRSILKFSQNNSCKILLLDNGATDGTGEKMEALSQHESRLRVIHADHQLGDGAAKNVLIKSSNSKYFIFFDTSVEVLGTFLGRIRDMLKETNVGVVGFTGLRTKDLLHFHEGEGESGEMDAMQAYCFAFRTSDVPEVGLMRESFRYYRNLDLDYSFQFKEKGYKIVADHSLPFQLHEHRGWTEFGETEREDLSRKNYGRFLQKWRNRHDLLISSR